MRVAILSAIRDDWGQAGCLVESLEQFRSNSEFDASIWLVDDGSSSRPPNWNSLAMGKNEVHVLELQGAQGQARALSIALAYLILEREESYDAFLLCDCSHACDSRTIAQITEAAGHHPESVIFSRPKHGKGGMLRRASGGWNRLLAKALCGEVIERSPLLLLPPRAAEALCHSCHAGNHLEAAIARLRLPRKCTNTAPPPSHAPALSSARSMLAAASVFRDDAFARIYAFMGAALLACLALAAAATFAAAFGAAIPGYVLPLALGMAGGFAFLAAGAALFAVSSQASSENRRWTPALDSTMLIRKVTLLRREPYALPSAR